MSQYKPYPAYKDSGVKWLGKVPEHWCVTRLRYAAVLNPSIRADLLTDDDPEVSFLPMESIGEDGSLNLDQSRPVSAVRNGYSYFEDGDVAFAKVTPCFENGKGTLMKGLQHAAGFGTTELTVLRPRAETVASYLNYVVQSTGFRMLGAGAMTGAGGLKRVPDEFTRNFSMALPDVSEQRDVALHLDSETARIDALIEKKTRFIELLREKRQALITHAVTKGLNPNAKMKDSGVEWLGEVPEHWQIKPLKYIGDAIIGLTYSPDDLTDESDGVLVLRSSNIQDGKIALDDNVFVKTTIPADLRTREDDILICSRNGSRALIGKNALIDASAAGLSFGAFTTVFRSGASKFIYYVLNSALFKFQAGRFLTTTINQLTTETLNSFEIPLPPSEEQKEIFTWLNDRLEILDAIVSKTERSIELLKERRSALITAAVTGQIDLREAS